MLAMPNLVSKHSSIVYIEVVSYVLDRFKIIADRLGYFTINNISINNNYI